MSVTVQCVDTGLKIQLPVGTSVSAVKQYLSSHPDVMVPMHEQVMLLAPSGTSIASSYQFSPSDGVFLYSKLALKPGHNAPMRQKMPVIQAQTPEKPPLADEVVRGWTTNPRLGTIHLSQHNYRHDLARARSYLDALVARRNASSECLEAMEVQQSGMQVARNSLTAHNEQKLKQQKQDSGRFKEILAVHSSLFDSFESDMEELRRTPLHSSLRHGHNWQTLIDCVPDERKLVEWAAKCREEHKRFTARLDSWHQRQQELSEDLQKEISRRCDVSYSTLERSLQDQDELMAHAKTLEQHIGANLQRVTDFIAGSAAVSMSQSQMLEDYDVNSKQHERYLDKLAQMDSDSAQLYDTFREARRKLNDHVKARLQAISSFQALVMQLYSESVIYQQTLSGQEDRVRYLEAVHKMPEAYRACEAHLVHRTHFKKNMQEQLQAVNTRLRDVLVQEQTVREEFWRENGAYLPTHLVPGLTDLVPNFRVAEEPFDEQLPAIDDDSIRSDADFEIIIAADVSVDKEKESLREQQEYASQRISELERLLAEKVQALDATEEAAQSYEKMAKQGNDKVMALEKKVVELEAAAKEKNELFKKKIAEASAAESGAVAELQQANQNATMLAKNLAEEKDAAEGTKLRLEMVEKELACAITLFSAVTDVASSAGVALPLADATATVEDRVESTVLALTDISQALGFRKAELTQLSQNVELLKTELEEVRKRNNDVEASNRDLEEASTASSSQLSQKLVVAEAATRAARSAAEDAKTLAKRKQEELEKVQEEFAVLKEDFLKSTAAVKALETVVEEKGHLADAAKAESVVLQAELEEQTRQLSLFRDEASTRTMQMEKEKEDLTSSIVTSASLSSARQQELDDLKATLDREKKQRATDARKAKAAVDKVKEELKAVVQEKNDSLLEKEKATSDLLKLRNSSQMGLYVAERVKDSVKSMPQTMKELLKVTDMSDPAEVFGELIHVVAAMTHSTGQDGRPMVALNGFKTQDYVLFFKNGRGVYEALNIGSPHYFLAPECLDVYEEEIKNNLCIVGEIVRLEQCTAIEGFNEYKLDDGQPFFVVTIAQCDFASAPQ